MGVDWANLPVDLLIDIAKRCKSVEDMAMFSCVCTSWNAVYSIAKAKLAPAVPWLMLPDKIQNSSFKWEVLNPSTMKAYNMELPETRGGWCWGCADGWIFTLSTKMDIELFNPLTKTRISLPSANTFPVLEEIIDTYDPKNLDWFIISCIESIRLIHIPPDDQLCIIVMYDKFAMAFARPGDLVWSALDCCYKNYPGTETFLSIQTAVGFNGEILLLHGDGKLSSLVKLDSFGADPSAFPRGMFKDEADFVAHVYVPGGMGGPVSLCAVEGEDNPRRRLYMLDSFGDLLVAVEYLKDDLDCDLPVEELRTLRFEVFKFDSEGKKWAMQNNIGDVALFLGDKSAIAVRASGAGNCKPNCIYLIEDKVYSDAEVQYAVGVFDMSTGVMEEIYLGDDHLYEGCSPFWLMPKLV